MLYEMTELIFELWLYGAAIVRCGWLIWSIKKRWISGTLNLTWQKISLLISFFLPTETVRQCHFCTWKLRNDMNFYREYVTKWTIFDTINGSMHVRYCTWSKSGLLQWNSFFFHKLSMSNYSTRIIREPSSYWRSLKTSIQNQNNFFLGRGLNNWSQNPFKANGIDNCAFLRKWINFTLENGIEICKWSHQLNSLVSFNIRISLPLNCKVIVMCLKRKIKIFNFKLCLILITDLAGWYECEWKFAQLRKIGWIAKDNVLFLMTWVIWIDPKKTPQCCEEQNREKNVLTLIRSQSIL